MKHSNYRHHRREHPRMQALEKLIYLPGAFIIAYGLWLSITVTG